MDIAALSTEMHQYSLSQSVDIALIKKAMDTNEENTQTMIKTMELSVNPKLGGNIDIRI